MSLLLLLLGCAEAPPPRPPAAIPVVTAPVVRGEQVVRLTLTGELSSPAEADVAAEVAGTVVSVPARVGTVVKAGDVLVGLDARSLDIARRVAAARVEQAEAQVAVRAAAVERVGVTTSRVLEVRRKDPASVSALEEEDAKLALAEAKAQAQSAEADLAVARAQLDAAQLDLSRARVISPVAGVVARQDARVGQRVAAGASLATVVGSGALEAVLDLGEAQSGRVVPGAPVTISLLGRPEVQARGTVAGVSTAANRASRNQRLRVDLPDPPEGLLPGLAVTAVVEVTRLADGIAVPRDAVVSGGVFVVADGKVARVPVTVSFDVGEQLIVDGALSAGQAVVVRGTEALRDGADVSVVGEVAAAP